MNKTNILLAVGIVFALIFSVVAVYKPAQVVVKEMVGATAGPDFYDTINFRQSFADGSNCYSTTTTGTLTSDVLANNKCIVVAATGAGQAVVSLTLQATTTMGSLLPQKGACRSWWIDTTAVAAATTTTIVKGNGVNLVGLDATGAGTGADVIDGNEYGQLELCRETDGDVTGFVTEWIHAD